MALPSQNKYNLQHLKNIEKYSAEIRRIYISIIKDVSKLSSNIPLNKNSEFYFRNYPDLNKKVNKLLSEMNKQIYGTTVMGINSEWDLAVEKNNELAQYVFGKELKDLPVKVRDTYFSNNAVARKSFLYRKEKGLGLSDKVWNNTKQFKKELELALEVGIGNGKSAQSIAKDVKEYLNHPDKLFRRVRDKENGELRLSKAAAAYNPGRGRYRSSYKNALRLTRNEVNFSYERSNYEKRQQQDFIVGVRIKVSPNHNPADDKGGISCLSLQGDYPKKFDFTNKWHVNCKCMSTHILKTREELDTDVQRILAGKEPLKTSVNNVKGLPNQYTNFIEDNKEKWQNWKTQPRTFTLNKELEQPKVKKAFNVAEYEKQFKDVSKSPESEISLLYRNEFDKIRNEVNLSEEVMDSLNYWQSSNYKKVREYLTTGIEEAFNPLYPSTLVSEHVTRITDYINKARLKENKVLYRGVRGDFVNYLKGLEKGDIFSDVCFTATSTASDLTFGKFQLKILAKKGAPVANIGNTINEYEYLIQKGSKYKVIKKEDNLITLQLL